MHVAHICLVFYPKDEESHASKTCGCDYVPFCSTRRFKAVWTGSTDLRPVDAIMHLFGSFDKCVEPAMLFKTANQNQTLGTRLPSV